MPRKQRLNPNDSIISADNLPVFYKYRLTFPNNTDDNQQKSMSVQLMADIENLYSIDGRITMGIEHYTKGMVPCKPHVHIHFVSKESSATIREHFRKKFELIGKVQSCKAEVLVDEFKFWRYPLKQQMNASKVFVRTQGFEDEEVNRFIDVGYACWKQAAQIAIQKEEARQERSSRDRLFAYLDKRTYQSLRDCMIDAFKYYAEYEEQLNINAVKGYVHIYLLKKGIMSAEEMVDKYAV